VFADAASQVASSAAQAADSTRKADVSIGPEEASSKAIKEKGTAASQQVRQASYQFRDDLEAYLRDKFPKQRRDAVINRAKKVVQDIQENSDFQETADFVVDMIHKYATRVHSSVAAEGKQVDVQSDENLDIAMKDAQV